jgi:hypothetical protein
VETQHIAFFAGEERTFYLPMQRITIVERECGNVSIFELFFWLGSNLAQLGDDAVISGALPAKARQVRSIIVNALIGGGIDEKTAHELVELYCYPARPAIHDIGLAWQILNALVYGVELKKKAAATVESGPGPSVEASSWSTAQPSGSIGEPPRSAPTSKASRPITKRRAATAAPPR